MWFELKTGKKCQELNCLGHEIPGRHKNWMSFWKSQASAVTTGLSLKQCSRNSCPQFFLFALVWTWLCWWSVPREFTWRVNPQVVSWADIVPLVHSAQVGMTAVRLWKIGICILAPFQAQRCCFTNGEEKRTTKKKTFFLMFSDCLVAQDSKMSIPQIADVTGGFGDSETSCGSICTSVSWSHGSHCCSQ